MSQKYVLVKDFQLGTVLLHAGKVIDSAVYDTNLLLSIKAPLEPYNGDTAEFVEQTERLYARGQVFDLDPGSPDMSSLIRELQQNTYLSQKDWYVDPVGGSDLASGAVDAPLQTVAEFARRLGNFNVVKFAETVPDLAGLAINVHLLDDLPQSDTLNCTAVFGGNVSILNFQGTAKILHEGTFTSVTPSDLQQQAWEFADTALLNPTDYIGKRVRIISGPNAGGMSFILATEDTSPTVTPGMVRTCEWADPVAFNFSATPSIGDSYVIEELTKAAIGTLNLMGGPEAPEITGGFWGKNIWLQNIELGPAADGLDNPSYGFSMPGGGTFQFQTALYGCIINNFILCATGGQGVIDLIHCFTTGDSGGTDASLGGEAGIFGGAYLLPATNQGCASSRGGSIDISLNTYFQGPLSRGLYAINFGAINCGSVAFFDCGPMFSFGGLVSCGVQGWGAGLSQNVGDPIYVWGKGNTGNAAVGVGESGNFGLVDHFGSDNIMDSFPVDLGGNAPLFVGAGFVYGEAADPGSGDLLCCAWDVTAHGFTDLRAITAASVDALTSAAGFVGFEAGPIFGGITIRFRCFEDPMDNSRITSRTVSFP